MEKGLSRAKRFVWCGDSDSAGYTLRADMVKLLGAARFWFVEWPEGTKDAGDLLRFGLERFPDAPLLRRAWSLLQRTCGGEESDEPWFSDGDPEYLRTPEPTPAIVAHARAPKIARPRASGLGINVIGFLSGNLGLGVTARLQLPAA